MRRVFLFIVLLIPLVFLLFELFIFQNVNDPIKYIYTITGATATIILFFTIAISLIRKWINLLKYRKMIGLFGFFYAFLHFLNFYILDAQLDFSFVLEETLDKPFIYLGIISFLILLFMAITSTKKLFKKFNNYHKLVYLVLILITIHFIMAQKSLSIPQFGYIGLIIILLTGKFIQIIKEKKYIRR